MARPAPTEPQLLSGMARKEVIDLATRRPGLLQRVLRGLPVLQHGDHLGALVSAQLFPATTTLVHLSSQLQPHRWVCRGDRK